MPNIKWWGRNRITTIETFMGNTEGSIAPSAKQRLKDTEANSTEVSFLVSASGNLASLD